MTVSRQRGMISAIMNHITSAWLYILSRWPSIYHDLYFVTMTYIPSPWPIFRHQSPMFHHNDLYIPSCIAFHKYFSTPYIPSSWSIIIIIIKKQDCLSRVVMVTYEKPQILNCNIQFYFKWIVQTITFKLWDKTQFECNGLFYWFEIELNITI